MSKEEETVSVKIPKAMAEAIQKREWFKFYCSLDDFVVSGVRREMEAWMRVETK